MTFVNSNWHLPRWNKTPLSARCWSSFAGVRACAMRAGIVQLLRLWLVWKFCFLIVWHVFDKVAVCYSGDKGVGREASIDQGPPASPPGVSVQRSIGSTRPAIVQGAPPSLWHPRSGVPSSCFLSTYTYTNIMHTTRAPSIFAGFVIRHVDTSLLTEDKQYWSIREECSLHELIDCVRWTNSFLSRLTLKQRRPACLHPTESLRLCGVALRRLPSNTL